MTEKTQTTGDSQLDPKANQEPEEEQLNSNPEENLNETPEDAISSVEEEEVPGETAAVEETNTELSLVNEQAGDVEVVTTEDGSNAEEEVVSVEASEQETPTEMPEDMPEEFPVEAPEEEDTEAPVEEPEEDLVSDPVEEVVTEAVEEVVSEPLEEVAVDPVEEVVSEPLEEAAEAEKEIAGEEKVEELIAEAQEEIAAPAVSKTKGKSKGKVKPELDEEKDVEDEHESSDDNEDDKDNELISQLKEIEDSAVDQDEEEEEDEEEVEEPTEKYEDYSREELLKKLEEVVLEENIQKIKTRVALIKVAFLRLSREDQQLRMNAFIKEGGTRENYVAEADPLMDRFNEVFEIYKKNKAKYNEEQEVLKLRNLDAKKNILEELKELISSDESLKKTYDRFKELQTQWKEIGLVPASEINNLWQNYHFLVEKFFDKVKISKELRDLDLKKNMEMKVELCEKAEELLLEPSILKSFKQLQKYHEEWREIGPVPADKRDEIWERFKDATDKINERRREHYNSLAELRETNLDAKNELCNQAEQIVTAEANTIKEWQDNTRKINDLFSSWKSLGPAPKRENDEVWERFKTYLNTFFSNKKEYFSKLKQEQLNNFNLKLDICKEAESLKDSTDWKNTTRDLIELQKEWKKIGPVPRKHSDKIWKRFRAACDEFFHNKSEHFGSLQKNEKENLEKKLELIERVQKYEFGGNKSENLQVLKEFQREWMETGHVPIKEKDRVQKAFREAINQQLDKLNINSAEIRVSEYRPRYDQGRGHDRGHDRGDASPARREMGFLTGKINKLKEDIQLWENNIGFLANSKRAELVKKEFEEKIEKAKEELAENLAKLRELQESDD